MKRFTETEKWTDPWFRRLPPISKLVWLYLCDRCDQAGCWEVDLEAMQFAVGAPVTGVIRTHFQERVEVFDGGRFWWVPTFTAFQYGKQLDASNAFQRKALKVMDDRFGEGNVHPADSVPLIEPTEGIGTLRVLSPYPTGRVEEEEEEVELGEKAKGEGCMRAAGPTLDRAPLQQTSESEEKAAPRPRGARAAAGTREGCGPSRVDQGLDDSGVHLENEACRSTAWVGRLWNSLVVGPTRPFAPVRQWTRKRADQAAACVRLLGDRREDWERAFANVPLDDWLSRRRPSNEHPQWCASLDFLLGLTRKPPTTEMMVKLFEGHWGAKVLGPASSGQQAVQAVSETGGFTF